MSLYANLLKKKDPTAAAAAAPPPTISSEPVRYSFKKAEDEAKEEKKAPDAALRFQPSVKRRPQPSTAQKQKPRPSLAPPSSSSPDKQLHSSQADQKQPSAAASVVPESIENWIDEDADDYYVAEYQRHKQEQKERQKDAKKRRKKKSSQNHQDVREVDWNAIYDPEQPIRLEDYRGSLEELDSKYEWKRRLYAHQRNKKRAEVPPSPLPAIEKEDTRVQDEVQEDEDDDYEPPPAASIPPPPPPPIAGMPVPPPLTAPPSSHPAPYIHGLPPPLPGMPFPPGPWQLPPGAIPPPPPPPGMGFPPGIPIPPPHGIFVPPPPQFLPAQPPAIPSPVATPPVATPPAAPTPPAQSSAVISRAPVRFTQPSPKPEEDDGEEEVQGHGGLGFSSAAAPEEGEAGSDAGEEEEEEQPRSNRPGQKGFAKRLLQKYGWKEGEGLGASGTGITTILQHQTQKRKKKSDAEGGGWAGPAVGRIVGGKKQKVQGGADADNDGGSSWSIVAKFDGMLAGMDIDAEIRDGDLMQRMGEKMAEYGQVERLYIHRTDGRSEAVFVKYTSALSAYRAIQASNERDFMGNGRVVQSGFWDEEKFTQDIYE